MSVYTVAPNIDKNLMFRDIHMQSGENVTERIWSSTNYSSSVISYSTPPSSMSVWIDRCIMQEIPVTINYSGTTTGSPRITYMDGYVMLYFKSSGSYTA